ncbi:MAG TPA: TMEM165/GDT1 family protein [bacterium]|jgi:putative Ca2+/H+ antiporter (TMEM165/GDT1 family)|nr:TMEM165/GDT1 family protein [bacterium]
MTLNFTFDLTLFLSTFGLIFLAELPDKTAIAALVLATRNNPWAVFIGSASAFVIQSLVAVLFGSLFGLLPPHIIHTASGILFLVFAGMMWLRKQEEKEGSKEHLSFGKVVWTSFIVIFIAEWGDLTQLASATLVAKTHQVFTIFIASTAALWASTALAISIGHHAKKLIDPILLQKIAAAAFAIVGILLLTGFWD